MLLLPSMLLADVTGSINGVVRDPSQAAVKGVRIKVTNTQTNLSLETVTADDGSYRFLCPTCRNLQSKRRDHWLPAVQLDRHRAAGERPTTASTLLLKSAVSMSKSASSPTQPESRPRARNLAM